MCALTTKFVVARTATWRHTAFFRSASTGEDVFLGCQQWRLEDGADDGGEDHGGGDVGQEQGYLLSTHRQTDRAF